MQNPNLPNQNINYANPNTQPYGTNPGYPQINNQFPPNAQPHPGQATPPMYQAPNPAYPPQNNGAIPIYNYNQDQPLNTLPLDNRPIVVVNDNTNQVRANNNYAGQNRFYRGADRSSAENIECRNCHQVGFVFLQPEVDPCYCCFVIIMTIICFLFILLLCCPCAYHMSYICTNCGHKWKAET